MADRHSSPGAMSWLTGVLLLVALLYLGVLAGGTVTTRLMPTSGGMGWDQLADALGGVLVGTVLAVVGAIIALRALGTGGRLAVIVLAAVACAGLTAYLRATPVNVRVREAVPIVPPPVAPFSLTIGVADGLEARPPGAPRLPWQTLRISSNLSYDYVPIDRPSQQCLAIDALNSPEGIAALNALRTLLAATPRTLDCGEPCPSCDDVSLQWALEQERASLMLNDRCWLVHEQLQPLRLAVDGITTRLGGRAVCN